jgi:hypothetical protein
MAAKFLDKILFGLGVALAVGAGVGAGLYQKQATVVLNAKLSKGEPASYKPENIQLSLDPAQTWANPLHQGSGPDWIYEVFTSPYLYFDEDRVEIVPKSPYIPRQKKFGLEFVEVKPDRFRLQLQGVIGEDGVFKNVRDNDTIVARAGRKIPELDLEIIDFGMKDIPIDGSGDDPTPTTVKVPFATVLDTKTNEKVELIGGRLLMTCAPFAVLRLNDGPNKGKQLPPMKEGATYEDKDLDATYHIDKVVELPAPVITVTKQTRGVTEKPKDLVSPPKAPSASAQDSAKK